MKKYKSMDSYYYILKEWFPWDTSSIRHQKYRVVLIFKSAPVTKKKISDFHKKWVLCDMVGMIFTGGSSCMAGNSKTCIAM